MPIRAESHDLQGILEATLGIPFTPGNAIRVLRSGAEIFPVSARTGKGVPALTEHFVSLLPRVPGLTSSGSEK